MRHEQSYKLHYNHSPSKHYVIEPKGGELDYQLAYNNPVKFYNKVLSQQITSHKITTDKKGRQTLETQKTQRKVGRVLYKVTDQLTALFKQHYAEVNSTRNKSGNLHGELVE